MMTIGSGGGRKSGACDVCVMIDKDASEKSVGYCPMCKAWMCEGCRVSPARRARAAGMRALAGLRRGLGGRDDE